MNVKKFGDPRALDDMRETRVRELASPPRCAVRLVSAVAAIAAVVYIAAAFWRVFG